MDREATGVAEGSGGVIVLDNFQGNRSLHADSSARGAIWGLSLGTSREELFRALIEGIAYGAEQILRVFKSQGILVPDLIVCGGATQSDLYMQIVSNVTGVPISLTEERDAALVGCAVLAATGLGWYENLKSAAGKMVRIGKSIEPDGKAHQRYLPLVAQHEKTYEQLKELMFEREALIEEAARSENEIDTGIE